MNNPQRKHPRLKHYDYAQNGAYYVTICTEGRQCLLGEIDSNQVMILSDVGKTVKYYIEQIAVHYDYVSLVNYVIMPNHVHLLLQKDIPPQQFSENAVLKGSASLETIIHGFKVMTTKKLGRSIWQASFYEHVVRKSEDMQRISDYISANPRRWKTEDK